LTTPKIFDLNDVYGISRELPENYVVRDNVDGEFVKALTHKEHIVVYGTSKQGKTSLRKYNLTETDYVSLICQNRWTLAQLQGSILKAAGYTVEGTSTHTLTGEIKLSAKLTGGLNWGVFKAGVETAGETADGQTTTVTEAPMELDPEDVNDIISALNYAKAPKFIVLDDFHYLPEETQETFAVALKAFHESSDYQFIISGVWLDENRLLQYNGDLGGRVTSINADRWTLEQLGEVIHEGERLLNIKFDPAFVEGLLAGSFESVWVVQDVCLRACREAGISRTAESPTPTIYGDVAHLIKTTVGMHSARFNGFLPRFAEGFQNTRLEMYRWILSVVLNTPVPDLETGLSLSQISRAINDSHPEAPINAGNITQALQSTASLQVTHMRIKPIILDYDQTDRRLNVVDRTFLIWLQSQDRDSLIEMLDLRAS
jgi:hypothetical protein